MGIKFSHLMYGMLIFNRIQSCASRTPLWKVNANVIEGGKQLQQSQDLVDVGIVMFEKSHVLWPSCVPYVARSFI